MTESDEFPTVNVLASRPYCWEEESGKVHADICCDCRKEYEVLKKAFNNLKY